MTRMPLLKDNLLVPGILLEGFNNPADFTVSGAGATIAANADWFTEGTQSLRITAAAGVTAVVDRTAVINTQAMRQKTCHIEFDLNIETDVTTTFSKLWLTLKNAAGSLMSITEFGTDIFLKPGVNHISVNAQAFHDAFNGQITGAAGSFDAYTKLQIRLFAKAGQTCTVSIDNLVMGAMYQPTVCMMFDDGYKSVIDIAYPIMQALGIVGTVYVIPSAVGLTGNMTLADLHTLHDAGWCIANHTKDHTALSGVPLADQIYQIGECDKWLAANGFHSGVGHVAYPTTVYDANTIIAMKQLGAKTGRAGNGGQAATDKGYLYNPINRNCEVAEIGTILSLATKSMSLADESQMRWQFMYCQQNRTPLLTYIHKIGTYVDDPLMVDTTAFTNLMKLLAATKVRTLNIDQFYNKIEGRRIA